MKSSFKLAIQIGAAVSGSFKTAIRGSQVQLNQLGGALKKLRSQQQAIGKFEMAEANLGKARVAYNAAAKEVMRLRKEMAATEQPSKKLIQSFELAKQKSASLSIKLGSQKDKLRQVRRELDGAGIDTRKLASENKRLGSTLDRLNTKYKKLTQSMRAQESVKARRAGLRGQLFDAVALGAVIAAPVKVAVDFEQSIAKLGAITRADEKSLQSLETTARKLGETTLFTASQSAEAMTFLGMAGFKTNQILAATPGMLNLAQAAGSDLAVTADIASNILSGFSLEAEQMGRVGDILSATFTTSNTTLQMLGDTLKYAAPVASATGASLEEVAAMAGLLGNVGIQGGMAGTALRAAFLRLSAPPKMAAYAIEQLGLSVKDTEGNLRSMPVLLKEIGMATQSMGTAEQAAIIKKLFGSEAAAGMTELLKQAGSGALDDYIAQLQKAKGTANEMAQKMGDTTSGALKRLGSAMESMAISLGNVLLPTVSAGAGVFASFASGISSASQEYPFLTKVVVGATAGLIVLKVTAIAGAYAFTFLKGGVLTLVTAYRTLSAGIALAQLGMARMNVLAGLSAIRMGIVTAAQWALNIAMTANPIGLIVVGIAALAGAAYMLIQHWEPIGEFFSSLWQGVKDMTSSAVDWIVGKLDFLGKPMEMLGSTWDSVTGFFGDDEPKSKPKNNIGKLARATVGTALVASTPVMAATQSPELPAVMQQTRSPVEQVIQIDAPITINALPGMDERAIALEVKKALEQQESRAMSDKRSALYDEAS